MTTQQATATQQVADRFNELAQQGRFDVVLDELYAEDAISREPIGNKFLPDAEGLAAIRKKGEDFNNGIQEVHNGWCSAPVVGDAFFCVSMGMEVTMKGDTERTIMDELCVYEVKDGKIVKEEFFYTV